MIAKEMIRNWDIREVCVDCKHLMETYEYDGILDEEFHYFECSKNNIVSCHGVSCHDMNCKDKIRGDNNIYDEKKDKEWEKRTRNKIKEFLLKSICPYCDCKLIYKDETPRYLNKCMDGILHDIKHGKCYHKIEGVNR